MAKMINTNTEIEPGDYVEIIEGQNVGFIGIVDFSFTDEGIEKFPVISETDEDEFFYATKIKLFKKV